MISSKVLNAKNDFPIFKQKVYGQDLVYLDSAATTQKPQIVIDSIKKFYEEDCANINRGAYLLSQRATQKYQESRNTVAKFINALADEIIFTKSCTESINLVANSFKKFLKPKDEILITEMEHHSNIVPWYMIAKELDLKLQVVKITNEGLLDINHLKSILNKKIKFASIIHVSNALGTINPLEEIISLIKSFDIPLMIDGSQAISHLEIDVNKLNIDFYAFSAHKVYAPFGVGVLFAKNNWLNTLSVYQTGGDMINSVSFDDITFLDNYQKFEAGTQNPADAFGLKCALEYVKNLGIKQIADYEQELHDHALTELNKLPFINTFGPTKNKVGIIAFNINNVHPHDVSSILDRQGVAIRAGHLCTQPLIKKFNVNAFCRASFAFYNTHNDVEKFIQACIKVREVFKI